MSMYDRPARVLRPGIEPGRRVLVVSDIHGNLIYKKSMGGFPDEVN